MVQTILKVENLHKSYGKVQVIKGINFEVKKGETK
ncbi:MAG: glutamine ABC transporter ATP-binding protein GlnQ, partial [Chloroflexota bacterium]|nr:glutamine ABC transporter ATP-binding protein GlnQ [Chloroflexota bacterium]